MSVEIRVPSVGESITEGVLARWLVEEGAFVQKGDGLFEMETDKTNTEIPAPESGTVKRAAGEGDVVKVGAVVGSIDPNGKGAAPAPKAAPAPEKKSLSQLPPPPPGAAPAPAPAPVPAAKAPAPPPPPPAPAPVPGSRNVRRERMSRLRKTIADRMVEAQHTAAILTTFNEVDMSAVLGLRARYKESFKERHGVGLGFMSFFVKAAIEALRQFPKVNASIEGDEIVYHEFYDIGVAVGADKGLVVPILRNAETLSMAAIEKEVARLAAKARDGKIELSDLEGGTFTISNVGTYGPLMGTPILSPPQTGILGMYAMKERPIVTEKKEVAVRPMMYLAFSYDHRLLDGKDAASFLVRVKELIESPERLLLEA